MGGVFGRSWSWRLRYFCVIAVAKDREPLIRRGFREVAGHFVEEGVGHDERVIARGIARAQPRQADLVRDVEDVQHGCDTGGLDDFLELAALAARVRREIEDDRHARPEECHDVRFHGGLDPARA